MLLWCLDTNFYCKCGCGRETKSGRRYISGHNAIGHIVSDVTRAKISLGNVGKKRSKEAIKKYSTSKIGEKNPNFGKPLSEEEKMNLSIKLGGKNHPFWQGGITDDPYGPGNTESFREQVRIRDNYTCQECGKIWNRIEKRFDPHHIDYNKNNHGFWNRITLCRSCHMKTNLNRSYWKEKFSLLILAKYNRLIL